MRKWVIGVFVAALVAPVSAQEISAEGDQALWCATALTMIDQMGAYPPEAADVVAVTRVWYRKAFAAFDAAGLDDAEADMLTQSYIDELGMQLPDYLISGDPDALRLDINACFEP